jgi:hypothetical protein
MSGLSLPAISTMLGVGGTTMRAILVLIAILFSVPAHAQQRCTLSDGTSIAFGTSVPHYTDSTIRYPGTCADISSIRTCGSYGVLTGNSEAKYPHCTAYGFAGPAPTLNSCGLGYRGGPPLLEHGNSVIRYRSAVVTPPTTCADVAQSRQCLDSKLMGDPEYSEPTCQVASVSPSPRPQTSQNPSWERVIHDIRYLLSNNEFAHTLPQAETIIAIVAALFIVVALWTKRLSLAAKPTAPTEPLRQNASQPRQPSPQRENPKEAPQRQKAPPPEPQQTVAEQSPGPGKLTGYEIERPWENTEETSDSSPPDRVQTSSAQPQPSARQNQSTQFTTEPILTRPPGDGMSFLLKMIANTPTYVALYLLFMVPTYLLPYFGSNSAALNAYGKSVGMGFLPAFWFHLVLLLILCALAWARGTYVAKTWLVVFPIIALAFDLVAGLNFVPFVPTVMHLCAIIIGVKSQKALA